MYEILVDLSNLAQGRLQPPFKAGKQSSPSIFHGVC